MADKGVPQYQELLPPVDKPSEVGRKVFSMLEEVIAEKTRLGLTNKWLNHYRLGRNQPWTGAGKPNIPLASVPLMFTHRQRTVNTLTDNNPTFNVPQIDGQVDQATYDTIGRSADYWWREQEQQAVLEKSIINGETYGVAIEKVVFNPDLEYGMGEIETVVVDPFYFGVYPVTCQEVQKSEAVLYYRPMSVREAKRLWPNAADKIKSDTELLTQIGDDRADNINPNPGGPRGFMGLLRTFLGSSAGQGGLSVRDDQVLVCECWVKDYTMEKSIEVDELGTEIEVSRPKYPGYIRCVTVCCGGTVVLDDKPNPSISPMLEQEEAMRCYLYDKFPFAAVNSITDPCTFWGMSDFEQLEALQFEMNKCLSQIIYHKDRCARPKIINPKDSGVNNNQFTNVQGILNPASYSSAQGIRYLEFPNNTQDIQNVFELTKSLFMLVGGTFDMDQAASINGDSRLALKSIQTLIERQATMMRGKIRNYYRLIRERGRMFVSLMQNWYTEDRWISFEDQGQSMSMPVNGKKLRVPTRLTVVDGSTMPISKVARREEAQELFAKGAMDRRALHEALETPGRAELNQRMDMGPNGVLLERAGEAGLPPEAVQWLQQLGSMDDKSFAIQKSKKQLPIPPVQPAEGDPAAMERMASVQKLQAEAQKMAAEAQQSQAAAQKMMADIQAMQAELQFKARDADRKDAEIGLKRGDQDVSRLAVVAQIKQAQASGRKGDLEDAKFQHQQRMDHSKAGLEMLKKASDEQQYERDREHEAEQKTMDRMHDEDMQEKMTALAQTQARGNSTNPGGQK